MPKLRAQAQQRAAQNIQAYQRHIQLVQQRGQPVPAYLQVTQQQLEDQIFQSLQREVGSAVAEKGILAVAGACCSEAAVGPVQKYLKDWYGYRAGQCKALIAMLSRIDRPSAIQYLLSISNRFRTKGIREEAEKYVNLLAARKGWTLDELADRTMPTAGLDEQGQLELSFGPRKFILKVNSNLEPVLSDGNGKILKALPAPRNDDDAELAKAAKKAFSSAKSELKKFTKSQTVRLYEAMCTQRSWPAADWKTFLLAHPLLKFLCTRLVWSVYNGSQLRGTFRPLDDGSLTDHEDNEMKLPDDSRIQIAHSCQLSDNVVAAWRQHLADYEISPLFTQFRNAAYTVPDDKRQHTSIADFRGHLVEAFKLRGLATKSGYTRGAAADGGWFFAYEKLFPGIRVKVELEFSGNGLPEENRTVALVKMAFLATSGNAQEDGSPDGGGMSLSDVPSVLLTECYNDLATIAAAGPGFDSEWEKKVY